MKKSYVTKRLSIKLCRDNPEIIYVFGDNLISKGKSGQAVIRDEPNSFGIPTKRLPSMTSNSFFRDRLDEKTELYKRLVELKSLHEIGKTIVFLKDGLGTGLAKMKSNSPKLFDFMNDYIYDNFNIRF